MKRLYVLYDQECALCLRCGRWLARQEAFIELRFVPLQSPEISQRFPGLKEWDQLDLREKLVVVSDEGAVYQGQQAWIMCLYALRDYREWSQRLAHPALLPYARRVCELVSKNRLLLSRFLKEPTEELRNRPALLSPGIISNTWRMRLAMEALLEIKKENDDAVHRPWIGLLPTTLFTAFAATSRATPAWSFLK